MRRLYLIPILLVALAILISPAAAATRFEIKYRVVGELRPGNEVIFQFMLTRVSTTGGVKPVTDAVFTVVVNGGKPEEVEAGEDGIASIPVKISAYSLLGSAIRVEVKARSQLYQVEASRTIVEHIPCDTMALLAVALASISIAIPLGILLRRVRG